MVDICHILWNFLYRTYTSLPNLLFLFHRHKEFVVWPIILCYRWPLSLFKMNSKSRPSTTEHPICHAMAIYVFHSCDGASVSDISLNHSQRSPFISIFLKIFISMCLKSHLIPVSVLFGQLKILLLFFIQVDRARSIHNLRKADNLVLNAFPVKTFSTLIV